MDARESYIEEGGAVNAGITRQGRRWVAADVWAPSGRGRSREGEWKPAAALAAERAKTAGPADAVLGLHA